LQERNTIEIEVTPNDQDGSETFVMEILDNLPSVTIGREVFPTELYGAEGALLIATDGKFTLTAADIEVFELKPPLHYSSALQGDITLNTKTIVTDGETAAEFDLDIIVVSIQPGQQRLQASMAHTFLPRETQDIEGVADQPLSETIVINGVEDEPYDIGSAIDLDGVLIDTDGSETLTIRLSGLDAGVIPTSDVEGGVSYLGSGSWSISLDAVANLSTC
jgi:hypothetical protein